MTESEKITRLEVENFSLRQQVRDLSREVNELRKCLKHHGRQANADKMIRGLKL